MPNEPMTEEQIREEFERDNCVVRDGVKSHFIYAGEKHGDVYIRKDILLSDTRRARRLVAELGRRILDRGLDAGIEAVIGPEKSGIVMAHRVADCLDGIADAADEPRRVRAYYAEKDRRGEEEIFVLRRDFPLAVRGTRVLIAEDIVNEATTARRVVEAVMVAGGTVAGVVALWNRGAQREIVLPMPGTSRKIKIPIVALIEERLDAWPKEDCPFCARGIPLNFALGHAASLKITA